MPPPARSVRSKPLRRAAALVALVALLALLGVQPGPAARAAEAERAPLLQGLGDQSLAPATQVPRARRYFHQGMLLVYGFNPAEAVRSFEAAVALDPRCATCWWALAWALGPNINSDMAPEAAPRVQQALAEARRHAQRAPALQRELIAALSRRHPGPGALNEEAYAKALRAMARRHPSDANVAMLAAEALLNLHPYDWWQPGGAPQPWTPEIEGLLQRALRLESGHAGANHYWIHLQESSAHPEHALPSAEALKTAVPGSGHLLHMPAHILMRTGRFDEAVQVSQRSIEADRRYLAQVDAQGAYRVGYAAHNHHFLWAAASMAGRQALALEAAQAARPAACGPSGRDPGTAIVQQYGVLPYFTLVRFGQWPTLLKDTLPPDTNAPYPLAIWHYARGTALARTGDLDGAQGELKRLEAVAAAPALAAVRIKNINGAAGVVRIALLSLRADIALAQGRPLAAVQWLAEATQVEDGLAYDEPHLWLAPTRHALGAALLEAGQGARAEQVFREDLAHYPANGWSLTGLAQALAQQGRTDAAAQARQQAQAALAQAERLPPSSRF